MVHAVCKVVVIVIAAWITIHLLSTEDDIDYSELLRGKNVLLTGASSGIGEEAAYYYAKLGANVVFAARREPLLQKVLAKCQALSPSGKFKYIVADFSKEDTAKKVVSEAVSFLGSLDFLLLNHAYLLTSTAELSSWKGTKEQYDRLKYSFDVNFLSYIKTSDAALPHLKKTNGSICVISSMIILTPKFALPYASSKSAMSTFFTGIRQELQQSKDNISITVIHLGLIPTEHSNDSLESMSITAGKDLKKELSILPVTSPTQCAEDIVRAFARREAEVYYPYNQVLWVARIFTILVSDFGAYEASVHSVFHAVVGIKNSLFGWL